MFAGKTEKLIELYEKCKLKKIAIKWSNDLRYSERRIVSHNGASIVSVSCNNLFDISIKDLIDVEVIFIDESQFFSDLTEFINSMNTIGKSIVFAGLEYDFKRESFGQTSEAKYLCSDVIILYALCGCGNKASLTKKKNKNVINTNVINTNVIDIGDSTNVIDIGDSTNVIDIGGSDKYEPVCEKCYII
jgi:thymidine kinase